MAKKQKDQTMEELENLMKDSSIKDEQSEQNDDPPELEELTCLKCPDGVKLDCKEYIAHMKEKHDEESFNCPICFTNLKSVPFISHMNQTHRTKPVTLNKDGTPRKPRTLKAKKDLKTSQGEGQGSSTGTPRGDSEKQIQGNPPKEMWFGSVNVTSVRLTSAIVNGIQEAGQIQDYQGAIDASKIGALLNLLSEEYEHKCEILALQETKLRLSTIPIFNELISSRGYRAHHKLGVQGRIMNWKRGLTVMFREEYFPVAGRPSSLVINQIRAENKRTFEYQALILFDKVLLLNIYRIQEYDKSNEKDGFLSDLFAVLIEVAVPYQRKGLQLMLCGDFNCPQLLGENDIENTINVNVQDIFDRFGLVQHVRQLTYVKNDETSSLLDLIITETESQLVNNVSVIHVPNVASDHRLVRCKLRLAPPDQAVAGGE